MRKRDSLQYDNVLASIDALAHLEEAQGPATSAWVHDTPLALLAA